MNEQAFPSVIPDANLDFSETLGLTKRELFAALALAGLLAHWEQDTLEDQVRMALKSADALIERLAAPPAQ